MLKGTVTGSVWSTKRVDDMPHGAFLEVELEGGASIVAFDILGVSKSDHLPVFFGAGICDPRINKQVRDEAFVEREHGAGDHARASA